MPYRVVPLENGHFYHVYNRGVEKRTIFESDRDYQRFLQTFEYYQISGPKPRFSQQKMFKVVEYKNNPKIVEVICYCLMPNHFHLLIRQLTEKGIQEFITKIQNSYTKYYNTKHMRVGHLFQGAFKSVLVESDEQLLQVSRYIHLNPYVSGLVEKPELWNLSSYNEYVNNGHGNSVKEPILGHFSGTNTYKDFVKDYEDYASRIEQIKHMIIEQDEYV